MNAGELKSKLVLRLRGPAHTDALMYQILSHSQRLINLHFREVLATISLTTTPEQIIYTLQNTGTMCVVGVRRGVTDLKPTTAKTLGYLSRSWGRARAAVARLWGAVGRQLILVYPATEDSQTLSVIGVKLLADFAAPTVTMELPDDQLVQVLDLAELTLLLKERRYDSLEPVSKRLAEGLGIQYVKSDSAGPGGGSVQSAGGSSNM